MKKRLLTLLSAAVLCGMVSGCCISHDWQEATCTAPKTCAKCGETEGEPKQSYFAQYGVDVPDGPVVHYGLHLL